MVKLLYKPISILSVLLAGIIANAVFSKVWKAVAHEDDAPDASDEERGLKEILPAVALKGAIAGVTRAVVQRGGAKGVRGLTGTWPA
ncbi:DUF4235 domain-containing protein [Streptomyces sp. WMMB 322]|uniref:DUF4235 domain-containing protein n=1 Tax=Streptomyces sp. WMMB 322 TaxID=1286821 RepID=UPI0006E3D194|nr:DUF4235 domain-containing protein [Streptomyces sp. WMMB 322]SCK43346.1 Protein of unknown function [Streptomyces sp. WMMB 322]